MGWNSSNEEHRADHYRYHMKHEPRPGDRDFPIRLETAIPASVEIAVLVRNPAVSLTAAADLIEQYARTRASEAAAEATLEVGNRMIASIEAPLSRKEGV